MINKINAVVVLATRSPSPRYGILGLLRSTDGLEMIQTWNLKTHRIAWQWHLNYDIKPPSWYSGDLLTPSVPQTICITVNYQLPRASWQFVTMGWHRVKLTSRLHCYLLRLLYRRHVRERGKWRRHGIDENRDYDRMIFYNKSIFLFYCYISFL